MTANQHLPLSGIKVIEFTHMVMGPTVGVILADLGADVVKIEPTKGDNTRRLVGSGSGYFPMYNRNKRSICLDMKSDEGKKVALQLLEDADVMVENFRPGALDKLGLDYQSLHSLNERLIYCSEKGFLKGPYENRTALDEVAQMMGGLAYMTGPPGQPLRAGASVIDVTGGMFGVIAILAALEERHRTGKGQHVKSSLFESTAYLVGQHIAQYAVTGTPAQPMPARISSWAVYDVFETADNDNIFVGVVSDTQWEAFCKAFGLPELADDPGYATNPERVKRRDSLIPTVRALFRQFSKAELMEKLEVTGLPYAPITKPQDLIEDPHLNADGGMIDVTLEDGTKARLPALPIEMAGERLGLRQDLPKIGEHTHEVLSSIGYSSEQIEQMASSGIIRRE